MSTETIADVEDILKDGETATEDDLKKLNIRFPVKQLSSSSVGSRRSSTSYVSAIKQRVAEKDKRAVLGRQENVEGKDKNGQVRFSASKVKLRKKKKGSRAKSSSRSRSRENTKTKKKKENKAESIYHDSEEDPDVSEIVLTKPGQVKNITVDGVLPGKIEYSRKL